jgi:biopolymer transport protein ExbD
MVNMKSLKVNLPTATTATSETRNDFLDISVDKAGTIYLDKKPVGNNELVATLAALQKTNASVRVFISGDREARHGDVVHALDLVRSAGIDKVAFEIKEDSTQAR